MFGETDAARIEGKLKAGYRRFRLLVWATGFALLSGLIGLGEPVENFLRVGRNALRQHQASGDIVVIAIDDKSLSDLASWPWPRGHHGALADAAAQAGARRLFFDADLSSPSTPTEDRKFAEALRRFPGEVVLAAAVSVDPTTGRVSEHLPLPSFAAHSKPASIALEYYYNGLVWNLPFARSFKAGTFPSFASKLAGVRNPVVGRNFPIDYAIDFRTVPTVSAVDLVQGRIAPGSLTGKTVIVGATSPQLGDIFLAPGGGRIPGIYLHVIGAETLQRSVPAVLGWLPPLLLAFGLACWIYSVRSTGRRIMLLVTGTLPLLIAPLALEMMSVIVDVMPAIGLLLVMAGRFGWLRYRAAYSAKAAVHPISGLPNLAALREADADHKRPLIVARVTNYAEIVASLPPEQEKALIEQVVGRLTLGSAAHKLYQGDGGVFVWFADDEMAVTLTDHLNALHSLFRSPVVLAMAQVDLTVAFGIETGSERSVANRLGSALVVADEAAAEGHRWKQYDAERLKEAPWRLSLLSQLDAAIDSGDLWIAYQPKFDLRTRTTVGAEALVRWTHPEKGPISPAEFVLAAEQSGRIHKLTSYVLERAVQSAAALNKRGLPFSIAVNLSARLIDDTLLPERVAGLLVRHNLAPNRLTLEITETAALGTSSAHLDNLARLRDLGLHISVDDYGTGLSTLDYLKKIPATEIKIDRSFVQAMHRSTGDRVIVNSTIQLAHSLGRSVVAEGVEDGETLEALTRMGCDLAQGFFIGRPVPFRSLARTLLQERAHGNVAAG